MVSSVRKCPTVTGDAITGVEKQAQCRQVIALPVIPREISNRQRCLGRRAQGGAIQKALFGETISSPLQYGRRSPGKIDLDLWINRLNHGDDPAPLFGETRVVRGDSARYLGRQRTLIQETRKRYFGRRMPLFEETASTAPRVQVIENKLSYAAVVAVNRF